MPKYPHLLESDLNYRNLPAIVRTAHLLGANYSDEVLENCEELGDSRLCRSTPISSARAGPPTYLINRPSP